MFTMISMTIDELYRRRGQQAALQSAAERQVTENKARCGRACDPDDFAQYLKARLTEAK
jgi:hypothetical protein